MSPPPPKSLPWLPLVLKWVNGDRWCSSICFYLFIFPLGLALCSPRALSTSVAWGVTNRSYGSVRVLRYPSPPLSRSQNSGQWQLLSFSLARDLRLALGWFPRAGVEGAPSRVGQNHRWAPLGLFSSLNPFVLPSPVRSLRSLRLPLSLSLFLCNNLAIKKVGIDDDLVRILAPTGSYSLPPCTHSYVVVCSFSYYSRRISSTRLTS